MSDSQIADAFLEYSRRMLLGEYWPRLRGCVESLTDNQVWWRPNEATNSIGNLLLHLNGNVRQWVIGSFTGRSDDRDRPAEFRQREQIPRATLLQGLDTTLAEVDQVLAALTTHDLLSTYNVQGDSVTGLEVVYHVVEHFGMHYGQVVFITKQLRGEELGFYRELDETGRWQ